MVNVTSASVKVDTCVDKRKKHHTKLISLKNKLKKN